MKAVILVTLTFFATCKKNVDHFNDVNYVKNGTFENQDHWNAGVNWQIIGGEAVFIKPVVDPADVYRVKSQNLTQNVDLQPNGYIIYYKVKAITGDLTVLYGGDTVFAQDYIGEMVKPLVVDSQLTNTLEFVATEHAIIDDIEIRNW